ncbi:unnamed protein product, partial [Prorocentrum cordatum]
APAVPAGPPLPGGAAPPLGLGGGAGPRRRWDVVLIADGVCTEEVAPVLARCIDALLAEHGEVVCVMPELRVGQEPSLSPRWRGAASPPRKSTSPQRSPRRPPRWAPGCAERCRIDRGAGAGHVLNEGPSRMRRGLVRWRRRSGPGPDAAGQLEAEMEEALARAEARVALPPGYLPEE